MTADRDARWGPLRTFVAQWYAAPLAPREGPDPFAHHGPRALREWFLEVDGRASAEGFLEFPDPRLFGEWPRIPRTARAHPADLARGVLPVVVCGGHGGWGIDVADPADDPVVHRLELDGEPSEPFEGRLSELLTYAVRWETIQGTAVLGDLHPDVHALGATAELGPAVRALVEALAPLAGWSTVSGGVESFLADPDQETVVLDDGDVSIATRTAAAWTRLQGALLRDAQVGSDGAAAERAAHDAAQVAALAALADGALPTTGPDLLAALEAIEDRLLRFEQGFLSDFRRQVQLGSATAGQLLKAGQILAKRGGGA